jgi:hypothetical protein
MNNMMVLIFCVCVGGGGGQLMVPWWFYASDVETVKKKKKKKDKTFVTSHILSRTLCSKTRITFGYTTGGNIVLMRKINFRTKKDIKDGEFGKHTSKLNCKD